MKAYKLLLTILGLGISLFFLFFFLIVVVTLLDVDVRFLVPMMQWSARLRCTRQLRHLDRSQMKYSSFNM